MGIKKIYAVLLVLFSAGAFFSPWAIESFELKLYDLIERFSAPGIDDPRVVIVGIDRKSLDRFGRWPWPRGRVGELIDSIAGGKPSAIGLDITFSTQTQKDIAQSVKELGQILQSEKIDELNPALYLKYKNISDLFQGDKVLADSITSAGNVVTGIMFHGSSATGNGDKKELLTKRELLSKYSIKRVNRDSASRSAIIDFHVGEGEPNVKIIQEAGKSSGFLNTITDDDGTVRAHPVVIEKDGSLYPSLSLALVMRGSGLFDSLAAWYEDGRFSGVSFGENSFLPLAGNGTMRIRYRGPDETYQIVSAGDLMAATPGDPVFDELKGRIVLVGAVATSIYDMRSTPMGSMAGVEIHANAITNILDGSFIEKYQWQNIYDALLALFCGLLVYVFVVRFGAAWGAFFTAALCVFLLVASYYSFLEFSYWLRVVPALLMSVTGYVAVSAYMFVVERSGRRYIKEAFGKYLSPAVIEQIIDNPDQLSLGGERRVMSSMFSDIAGFTTISEALSPTQLVTLLNEYLTQMSQIIHQLDGTIDKYEGDAIIAFWGAPVAMEDHAVRCVRAAVRQQQKLVELRERFRLTGHSELFVRIGINSGLMVVGNMGSAARMDYTVMGDAVNLAARLEGANRYYGSSILVSEFTWEMVKEEFTGRLLDRVRVQGKKSAVKVYEILGERSLAGILERRFIDSFAMAMRAFENFEFGFAMELFEYAEKIRMSGDLACKLYIKRSAELIKAPPPENWDMVYDLAK